MIWNKWKSRWQKTLSACNTIGGEARDLKIEQPATEDEVLSVESKLGLRLPETFRKVLIEFSSSVEFNWFLPEIELPNEFRQIFCGECSWNLNELIELEDNRKGWMESCFPNPDDEYDAVWHNKLAFLHVSNGDLIALDLDKMPEAPVIYLSHDDGEGHGYILGSNFTDFIDRWSLLGCVGAEDWQMLPFISSSTSGLEPNGENAQKWREWFGLDFG